MDNEKHMAWATSHKSHGKEKISTPEFNVQLKLEREGRKGRQLAVVLDLDGYSSCLQFHSTDRRVELMAVENVKCNRSLLHRC
jgi:hypothetical protein